MTIAELKQYHPQQIFLLQGGEKVFEILLADAMVAHPLTHAISVARLTIDHARDIARFAVEGDGSERIMLVYFAVFSPDAAQVLLKALEEPALHTTIVLITAHPYVVPQTIRSRVMMLQSDSVETKDKKQSILSKIKAEAENKDDDAAARRASAAVLLDELEVAIRNDRESVAVLYHAKELLYRANLPTKFVLDYVSTMVK